MFWIILLTLIVFFLWSEFDDYKEKTITINSTKKSLDINDIVNISDNIEETREQFFKDAKSDMKSFFKELNESLDRPTLNKKQHYLYIYHSRPNLEYT
jgi:hypothetical protein